MKDLSLTVTAWRSWQDAKHHSENHFQYLNVCKKLKYTKLFANFAKPMLAVRGFIFRFVNWKYFIVEVEF